MIPETLKTLLVAALAALVFAAGWFADGWRKDAEIAEIKAAQASAAEAAARQNLDALAEAERQGELLSARASAAEAARDTALQETQHALRQATTGRPCLNAGAVRLLNNPGAANLKPPGLPAAAGEPAGADATFASDTDVALWAAHARRSYDTCRGRIDAVNAFFNTDSAHE